MVHDFEHETYVMFECEAWLKSGDDPVCDFNEQVTVQAVGDADGYYFAFTCPQCGKHTEDAWAPF
jgi:hypothetical protein